MELTLKTNVLKANLSNRVLFVHDKFSVEEIINISDILVLPSSREGMGISLIEGLSLGKPIIGTDGTGMQEVIEHGHNGFLFKSNSVLDLSKYMNLLLSDTNLYKKMSMNARNSFVNIFNFDIYKKNTLLLLNELQKK